MTGFDMVLLAVLLLCVLAVVHPYTSYPLILRMLPDKPVARTGVVPTRVSLLFCAYNEAGAMPEKIANLAMLKARHPELEILTFDDGSSDGTAAMLAARGDLLTVVQGGGRNGKAHGMKRLAAMATGDVLVFTDANVTLDAGAIDALLAYYADPDVGGVMGSLHYSGAGESATASVGSLYWRMEEALKDLESRTGNVMGADGSIFSIRRALYPDFPDSVLDDLTVSMAVVFAGKRLIKARDVLAYERLVAARDDEYRRKVRIAARAYHTHQNMAAQRAEMGILDRFKYASRKWLRWFGAVFLTLGAGAALVLAWRIDPMVFAGCVLLGMVLALLGWRLRSGPVAAVTDVILAYFATLRGVINAMQGKLVVVWNPAKSR